MASSKVTSAKNWKKPGNHELTLPSGNVALVKRPGLEKLLMAGILPDSLTPIAMEAVASAQTGVKKPADRKAKKGETDDGMSPELMKKFLEKEGALQDIFAAFDKVTAMCVVEPKVEYHMRQVLDEDKSPRKGVDGKDVWEEIPADERDEDALYTDDVDHQDKEFIFEFVSGGDPDIARFRDSGDDVATP